MIIAHCISTCLHGGDFADIYNVHIVDTGRFADGFCWFLCVCIISPNLRLYQWLARQAILPMLTICYCQFDS